MNDEIATVKERIAKLKKEEELLELEAQAEKIEERLKAKRKKDGAIDKLGDFVFGKQK